MFKKKIGRLNSIIFTIAICFLLILPVSAQYIGMLDHNLYYNTVNSFPSMLYETGGAGEQIPSATGLTAMWALDSYDPGKTYTFEFKCILNRNDITLGTKKYLNLSHSPELFIDSTSLSKAYYSIEFNSDTRELKFIVKVNTDLTDLGGFPIYLYLYQALSTKYLSITTNGWATYAEVDAGGSEYIQNLVDEVAQMRENDETYYSSALQTLDEIKTGIDQIPGEISTVLEQHDQQNKQEASTEGNDNINQATSALTNALPIASISDAITPLITACSYNGITSVWSFPALKIPAIQGLFGEMQLSEQQNFDLCAYADQYIPDELLSIIRAVMTILLIVWAIREVMNLLSHLLGGGDG